MDKVLPSHSTTATDIPRVALGYLQGFIKSLLSSCMGQWPYYSSSAARQDRNYERNFLEIINRTSRNNLVPHFVYIESWMHKKIHKR